MDQYCTLPHFFHTLLFYKVVYFNFFKRAYDPTGQEELNSPFGTQKQTHPSKQGLKNTACMINQAPEKRMKQEHYASMKKYGNVEF